VSPRKSAGDGYLFPAKLNRLLIWGGGGHGKVVADLVRATGGVIVGFVDRDRRKLGRVVEPGGGRVVLLEEDLIARLTGSGEMPEGADAVALAIGDNVARLSRFETLGAGRAATLVHPSAIVSPSVTLGAGSVIMAGAILSADARVGSAVIVNTGAVVEHDCVIDHGVHLAPRCTLAGGVAVGRRTVVGVAATIIQQLRVGHDCVIGAGAVVIREVADSTTVVGVPARPIATNRQG
jgi:sugar O-acyltransferase (sialic acid O-acetyltransferase NeuD family)